MATLAEEIARRIQELDQAQQQRVLDFIEQIDNDWTEAEIAKVLELFRNPQPKTGAEIVEMVAQMGSGGWAIQALTGFNLSHNVRAFDALIASVSFRLQVPLYTRNLKHFSPILGTLVQVP